ncbi:3-galactosyl-N-acetylglucosaminide 4-alpha-L-fucosyltransferase FUT3-like isoform X1 [Watersipora subatra]|uniref:3-galactosyl-N-acetylglucosaminide 4-alpha-L-fucosyltransferase FUT3-like isoform X1 n=2 Tax=Watersipora subatra TaxID=2589382 RepID=UPI00355C605F
MQSIFIGFWSRCRTIRLKCIGSKRMGLRSKKKIILIIILLFISQHLLTTLYTRIYMTERQDSQHEATPKTVVFPKNGAYYVNTSYNFEKSLKGSTEAPESTQSKRLILAWTVLHSRKPLWGIRSWSFRKCAYSNCEITGNRSELDSADLVIFRIRELKPNLTAEPYRPYVQPIDTSDLPPYHKPDQLWMDINQESPVYTHADEELQPLNGLFNISSNYLLNSDFSISYIPIVKRSDNVTNSTIDYAKGKTKMALWFVSHCNAASGRDAYVQELQKYNITVDIFGKCSGISDGCSVKNLTCYQKVKQKYKFYLAFENSICSEYITEKFWNTLTSDSYNIPVALGARIEEYTKFAPPNSFLHTRNFTSVRALAEFMHRVDGDRELFNSFHKWRETHEIVQRFNGTSLHCYMCKQANEKPQKQNNYSNQTAYWSRKKSCNLSPEPIR